jgi:hypothetical protein
MKKINTKQQQNVSKNSVVLYTNTDGNVELRADVKKDTLWATQEQIAQIFGTTKQVISWHTVNIFKEGELNKISVVKESLTTAADGKRYKTNFYNLDSIIAVGYRVNSKKATQFRIWATTILRTYLVSGHALNTHVLTTSPDKFIGLDEAVALLKSSKHPGKLKGNLILKIKKEVV